jgi:hypothetical protein
MSFDTDGRRINGAGLSGLQWEGAFMDIIQRMFFVTAATSLFVLLGLGFISS